MRRRGWGAEFLKVSLKKCSTLLTRNLDFHYCRHPVRRKARKQRLHLFTKLEVAKDREQEALGNSVPPESPEEGLRSSSPPSR